MPNVIGYKDLSNLYIKPAAEPTRTISDIDLKSASEPERVLNPIVSESYMRQYIEEHGGITPTGNIEITENGENINVAPYATATVNVSGGGGGSDILTTANVVFNITGTGEYMAYISDLFHIEGQTGEEYLAATGITLSQTSQSESVVVALVNGGAAGSISATTGRIGSVTGVGDVEIENDDGWFAIITGDCTITINMLQAT